MSAEDRALIDTNVLLYAGDQDSKYYPAANALCAAAAAGDVSACIAPQVLLEYVSIVTNPWKSKGNPSGGAHRMPTTARLKVP